MRLFVCLLIFYSLSAWCNQSSVTTSHKKLKWDYTNIPVQIVNNSTSLPASNALIEQAIAEWNGLTKINIQKVSSSYNEIRFSNDFSLYGSAIIGITEVSYDSSGSINTATVYLNEQDYDFTNVPGMPSGNTVYLKDVVTHELGHFLGLAHSEVLNSSMFYSNYPGQSELAADDRAGIRAKYSTNFGKIKGYVKGGSHIGVLGVHVQAISRMKGEVISSISDQNGYFEIGGLDLSDTYYLYTSPLKKISSLPGYFANVQTEFCPAAYVGSFFSSCSRDQDGQPQGITLTPSRTTVDVGEVTINCSLRVQEDYLKEKLKSTFTAQPIFTYGDEPRWEKAFTGFFQRSKLSTLSPSLADKFEIDLTTLSIPTGKQLRINLVSQPFGNAVEYSMIVKKNGVPIVGSPFGKSNFPAGTLNLDVSVIETLSANPVQNFFEIEITAMQLFEWDVDDAIPDFSRFASDQSLPYLLTMSLEDPSGPLTYTGAPLSDNASCLDAPFTYKVARSTANAEDDVGTAAQAAAAASCGTIDPPSDPGNPGQFLSIMTLGFMVSALVSKFRKRAKNFLS